MKIVPFFLSLLMTVLLINIFGDVGAFAIWLILLAGMLFMNQRNNFRPKM